MQQLSASNLVLGVLDPGMTTGFVTYHLDSGLFIPEQLNFNDTCMRLMGLAVEHAANLIVVSESFRITMQTAKNTQAPWSLELIGVARMVSRLYTGRELHMQDPSSAKRFSSDAKLKHMGWYNSGKGHANDASRHLLLTLATRGWLPVETLRQLAEA
jgi:hypothetical protein